LWILFFVSAGVIDGGCFIEAVSGLLGGKKRSIVLRVLSTPSNE
jgi:hypothetical protein